MEGENHSGHGSGETQSGAPRGSVRSALRLRDPGPALCLHSVFTVARGVGLLLALPAAHTAEAQTPLPAALSRAVRVAGGVQTEAVAPRPAGFSSACRAEPSSVYRDLFITGHFLTGGFLGHI